MEIEGTKKIRAKPLSSKQKQPPFKGTIEKKINLHDIQQKQIQTNKMTSVKSAKLQLQSQPTQMLHKDEGVLQNNKSDDESQIDSSEEENQHIVNILFPQKKVKRRYMNQEAHTEEDSDIKRFLEEQIPGLYRARTNDEIYENSSEEQSPENLPQIEADYYMNYSVNTGPGYLQMSRFEKVSYFESLNAIYMAKMRTDSKKNPKQHFNKQNLQGDKQPQAQANKRQKNKKPAIRFNQIVCQVPFNKDQQPIAVRDTPEQQAFIVFDDEAYEDDYYQQEQEQQRIARQMLQTKKFKHMQKTQAYINQQEDESDSPQTLYNMERMRFLQELNDIQKYNGQGLDDQYDQEEHVFFTDSEDELLDFDHDQDEEDWPEDQDSFDEQLKQNHRKCENKMINQQQRKTLEWDKRKNWKRNYSRQFLEDNDQNDQQDHQSSSSGQESSSSSEGSSSVSSSNQQADQSEYPESLQIVKPLEQIQNKKEQTVQQEPQFQEGIKGRKINPNLVQQQSIPSDKSTLPINNLIQEVKEFPTCIPIQTLGAIITENNSISETPTKPQEQICQNTSEGQTIE